MIQDSHVNFIQHIGPQYGDVRPLDEAQMYTV